MDDREQSVQHFLDLIKRSQRGKFKVYIGMIAGVGKSYRMLQEAHELLENGVDVKIGYIETHGRVGTEGMLQGLPVIPRRKIFYKGKELEEMDLDSIKKLTDGAKNMAGVIESIVKLKSQVRAEEIKNSKVRGGGEMNPFELPKKKL